MPLNPPIRHWHGQRVWIIGASSGIGRALAQALQAQGAQVTVSARQAAALQTLVAQQPGMQALPLDVTQADAVAAAAQRLHAAGGLDFVCYCAGHYQPMRAHEMDLPELLRHQQINVVGALHVVAAVVPHLLQTAAQGRTPHLSLVASVAGWRGLPQGLAYGHTKAALIHLAENLFVDLRPRGVAVSVVNPGFVATPLTARNDFRMPALRTPQQAAQAMLQGWRQGAFALHFPRRLTVWLQLLRLLPYRWYFPLIHRLTGL